MIINNKRRRTSVDESGSRRFIVMMGARSNFFRSEKKKKRRRKECDPKKMCSSVFKKEGEREGEKKKYVWIEVKRRWSPQCVEEQAGLGVSTGEKNTKSFESVRCMHVLIYGRDPAARYRVPT